jgi:hypothetical protein
VTARFSRAGEPAAAVGGALLSTLDGTRLEDKVGFTLLLSTTDAAGWPHAAFLSVGEVVALSPTELALAVHAGSRTAGNLRRSSRAALVAVCAGQAQLVRIRCAFAETTAIGGVELACFRAGVTGVDHHEAPYATELTGIGFGLRDPGATLDRWQATVAALRALGRQQESRCGS